MSTGRRTGTGAAAGPVEPELFEELRAALAAGSGREPGEVTDGEVEACLEEVLAADGAPDADPAATSLESRLGALADEEPDALAVVWGDAALSRRALHGRADALAAQVRGLGLEPGATVAVDVEPSIDLVVALVGVLRAGATAAPLDASCPEAWRRRFAERAGAEALVARARDAGGAPSGLGLDLPVLTVPAEGAPGGGTEPTGASTAALVIEVAGEPLVLGGATVLERLDRLATALDAAGGGRAPGGDGESLVVVHGAPLAGDRWVAELLLPLVGVGHPDRATVGGRVVVAPRAAGRSAAALAREVERTRASTVRATPEELSELAAVAHGGEAGLPDAGPGAEGAPEEGRDVELRSLRTVLVEGPGPSDELSGEALPWSVILTAPAPEAGGELLLGVAAAAASGGRQERPGVRCALGPLGVASPYVLDRRGQPVPVGVWGELHAGVGDGVRGVAGSPAATAERFRPDPFAERPGGRVVATGLSGRLRPDGGYELGAAPEPRGRRAWRHGVWVDPGRIERVLCSAGGAAAALVARAGDGRLVAWVEAAQGTAWTERALAVAERTAAEHLAPWEAPELVVPCAALPRADDGGEERPERPERGGAAALETAARRLPLAVAATFTAKPLAEPLGFLLETLGLGPEIRFAPYAQVIQELLRPDGTLGSVGAGWNVLLVRLEDWAGKAGLGGPEEGAPGGGSLARETVEELLAALEQRSRGSLGGPAPPTLLVVCPSPADAAEASVAERHRLVATLERRLEPLPEVRLLDCAGLAESYAVAEPDDFRADELGHIPYTGELFAALAAALARELSSELAAGPSALAVGRLSAATAASPTLRGLLATQGAMGRTLCLWGSGEGVEALEGACAEGAGPGSVRRVEAVGDAAGTLRGLAAELGIPLGEWAFLGTDPAEHAAIVEGCDEVLALRLPADEERLRTFLGHLWPLDSLPRPAARPRGGAESATV